MANSADPDQLASEEANWSGCLFVFVLRFYGPSTQWSHVERSQFT